MRADSIWSGTTPISAAALPTGRSLQMCRFRQIAIPQKEENLERNTSLEQVGGGGMGVIHLEKKAEGEGNTSATSAYLQEHCATTRREEPWTHFRLLDVVLTPKGEGIVIQDWPMSVGVRLHDTQAVVYFERPEDILTIRVKSSLYAD